MLHPKAITITSTDDKYTLLFLNLLLKATYKTHDKETKNRAIQDALVSVSIMHANKSKPETIERKQSTLFFL
ncbi:TPA: hypothetical protein ACGG8M_003676, partial [Vibrio cholerae]